MPFNVFVTRKIPREGTDKLAQNGCLVHINPHDRGLTKGELISQIGKYDGVLSQLTDTVDNDILEAAIQTRVISNVAVGYNNIDVKNATRLGILITNTPGVLTSATADLAWALLFAAARRVVEGDAYTREGRFKSWDINLFLGAEITGKTLGVIGAGRIGTAVAMRSVGFGMRVLYYSNHRNEILEKILHARRKNLDVLLKESDFVSLHVPLLPETEHLIGSRELGMMKKTAFLINTSRGPVVDENALVQALRDKTIAGAGLDVYEREPMLEPGLTELDNVVLLPHLGSATLETRARMAVLAAENLIAGLKGKRPPNIVNAEAWKNPSRRKHD
jgi:glyoxylate reductase